MFCRRSFGLLSMYSAVCVCDSAKMKPAPVDSSDGPAKLTWSEKLQTNEYSLVNTSILTHLAAGNALHDSLSRSGAIQSSELFVGRDKSLVTKFVLFDKVNGYPGYVHGGIISLLLDDTFGLAEMVSYPGIHAVTANLTVNFLLPLPMNSTVYVVCRPTVKEGRKMYFEGSIESESGSVYASSTCLYVALKQKEQKI